MWLEFQQAYNLLFLCFDPSGTLLSNKTELMGHSSVKYQEAVGDQCMQPITILIGRVLTFLRSRSWFQKSCVRVHVKIFLKKNKRIDKNWCLRVLDKILFPSVSVSQNFFDSLFSYTLTNYCGENDKFLGKMHANLMVKTNANERVHSRNLCTRVHFKILAFTSKYAHNRTSNLSLYYFQWCRPKYSFLLITWSGSNQHRRFIWNVLRNCLFHRIEHIFDRKYVGLVSKVAYCRALSHWFWKYASNWFQTKKSIGRCGAAKFFTKLATYN